MNVQELIALTLAAVAGAALARHLWRAWRDQGACGGCGGCGKPPRADVRPAPEATPLITLERRPPRRG